MQRNAVPNEVDVTRARHDPAFRQTLLAAQLAQLASELDRARVTTAGSVTRLERMREEAKLAVELARVIGRIQQHLRIQDDACDHAA